MAYFKKKKKKVLFLSPKPCHQGYEELMKDPWQFQRLKFQISLSDRASTSTYQAKNFFYWIEYWKTEYPSLQDAWGEINFLIPKCFTGNTWTPWIISITMRSLWGCTLLWFTHIMEGLLFPICKFSFFPAGILSLKSSLLVCLVRASFSGEGVEILKCIFHS